MGALQTSNTLQKVIVVDGAYDRRHRNSEMLTECGLSVIAAGSADDALAYLEQHGQHVRAIFTDTTVGKGFDGADLAQTVAQSWPNIAVVLTSCCAAANIPSTSRFLPTPWHFPDMMAHVTGLLSPQTPRH